MNNYIIYKATNLLNNKIYIGLTTQNLNKRIISHKCNCFSKHIKSKFYNAIRKYGWDFFIWEIIEDNIVNVEILKERECYWISYFNSYKDGYNSTFGGEGTVGRLFKHKKSTKNKISNALKGKSFTEEHKEKLKNAHIDVSGKNNPFYNKTHTIETKNKIKNKLKNRENYNGNIYILIDPLGVKYENVYNLKKFCNDFELNYNSIRRYKNKTLRCGWTILIKQGKK